MNDKKHVILCVDGEKRILTSLKRLLKKEDIQVLTASGCQEGLDILEENDIHLVISDQRMPQMSGVEFLSKVKEKYPDTIRIVLTGYTDVDTIRDAINEGNIYKFILKPWNDVNIIDEIKKSLEQYDLIQTNKALNEIIIEKNKQLEQINKQLEKTIGIRTRELELQVEALELSRALFEGMPAPVIGLNIDKMIVLINKEAQALEIDNQKFMVGKSIEEYISREMVDKIDPVFKSKENSIRIFQEINHSEYLLTFSAMTGKFRGRGVILYFQRQVK